MIFTKITSADQLKKSRRYLIVQSGEISLARYAYDNRLELDDESTFPLDTCECYEIIIESKYRIVRYSEDIAWKYTVKDSDGKEIAGFDSLEHTKNFLDLIEPRISHEYMINETDN